LLPRTYSRNLCSISWNDWRTATQIAEYSNKLGF
jgi:hypothetical protein